MNNESQNIFLRTTYHRLLTKGGFTLIELIIVIAVFAVIAAIGIAPFTFFKNTNALSSALEESVSLLLEARTKTLSSQNESQYGVYFKDDSATLFMGNVFNDNDSNNKTVPFSSVIEVSNISLNGGVDSIVFSRLTGETNDYGTIIFRLKSDTQTTRTLRIESTGVISTD